MEHITDDELASIAQQIGILDPAAKDRMPESWSDPAPAVVERARAILRGTVEQQVVEVDTVADDDKIAFLSHVLVGVRFTKQYDLPVGIRATLGTLSAAQKVEIDRQVAGLAERQGWTTAQAKITLQTWRLAYSVVGYESNGVAKLLPVLPEQENCASAVDQWLMFWQAPQLQLLQEVFQQFQSLVNTLVAKATGDDRSFWQTLL